jgi:hypothetical protein
MTRSKTSVESPVDYRIASLAIVALIAGTSTQVQAQDVFVSLDTASRPVAAEDMERRAGDVLDGGRFAGHGWERAAGLYISAAELRGSGDPKSADNLRVAGYLQYYRGRSKAAVASLTQAGEAFLALGYTVLAGSRLVEFTGSFSWDHFLVPGRPSGASALQPAVFRAAFGASMYFQAL